MKVSPSFLKLVALHLWFLLIRCSLRCKVFSLFSLLIFSKPNDMSWAQKGSGQL